MAKLNKNRKNIKLELIQGASTLLNINNMSLLSSCNNMKNNIDYLNMGYNHTENIGKSMKKHKLESTFINPESTSKRDFHNSDAYKKNRKIKWMELRYTI